MTISVIISVDGDVVQIHNDENVKLLSKDLVDKSLEACRCVCEPERHHLILKVAVLSPERGLLLISFADSHLMVCTSKVKLGKLPSPS